MVFEALSGRLSLNSSSFRRGLERAQSSAASFGTTASGAFERVSSSAAESGRSARLAGMGFNALAEDLRNSAIAGRLAAAGIDRAGDEARMAGVEAAAGAGGMTAMSAAGTGLSTTMFGLSGSITTVTLTLGGLLAVLSPLVLTFGTLAAGAAAVAGAFGLIIGSGILAWGKQGQKAFAQMTKEVKKIVAQFGQQFVPLLKDAVAVFPSLVRSILKAAGNMQPFVRALRALGSAAMTILPKLVALFFDLGRTILPILTRIGSFIAANIVPALRAFFAAGKRAIGPVMALGTALFNLGKALAPIAGLAGRVVLQLYNFAAGAVGAVASGVAAVINALRRGISAFRNVRRTVGLMNDSLKETFAMMPGLVRRGMALVRAVITGQTKLIGKRWRAFMMCLRGVAEAGIGAVETTISRGLLLIQKTFKALVGGWGKQVTNAMNYMRMAFSAGLATVLATLLGFRKAATANWSQTMYALAQVTRAAGKLITRAFGTQLRALRTRIRQFTTAAFTLMQMAFRRLPAPVRRALTIIGGAIRGFTTRAIAALRQFAAMVRTAIKRPIATFRQLRTQLNQLLPPFLRIQTTAKQLGSVISSTLLPALGAAGLLGIATRLTPILTGLIGVFARFRGAGLRLASLFAGPLIGGIMMLLSPLTRLGVLITGTLLPALTSVATTVGGILLSSLTSLASLVGGVLLSGLTTLSTLISGALSLGFTGLISTLFSTSTALTVVSGAVSALLSPIGLLVAAVAGLYAAWKTNLFGIRRIGLQVFSAIKAAVVGDMGAAQRRFRKATRMMGVSWKTNIKPLIASARRIFTQIRNVVQQAMNWIVNNAVRPALRGLTQIWRRHMSHIEEDTRQLQTFLTGVFNALKVAIGAFVKGAVAAWRMFGDEILVVTKYAFDLIGSTIGAVLDTIGTLIDVATDLMVGDWKGALKALRGLTSRIFGGILSFVRKWGSGLVQFIAKTGANLKRAFVNAIITMANLVGRKIQALVQGIMRWLGSLPGKAARAVNSLKVTFVNGIIRMANLAVKWAGKLVDMVVRKLKSLAGEAKQAAKGMISGFVNGIKSKMDAVGNAVGDILAKARKKLPGSDAEEGPLSDLTASGAALPQTFAQGILSNKSVVARAANEVARAARLDVASRADMAATTSFGGGAGGPVTPTPAAGSAGTQRGRGESGGSGPDKLVVQLSEEGTKKVMRGEAVEVVAENEQDKDRAIDRARSSFGGS
jgi:phage-related protein